MKLKSNVLKFRRNGRTVYSARTNAVHNELQRINKEVINKYGLKIPNRNAIIKTIIQFLSQGEIYSNRRELPLTPLQFKVIKMDIKNFFPSINKHILYSKIVRSSILNDSSIETIKSFIFSNAYMGIPLGLAFSNSLSELYLEEFDSAIQLNWKPLLYVRYVDDILLIVNERIDENDVVKFVKKELKNYHLEVNDAKTDFQVSSNQFSFTYLGYKFSKFQKKTKRKSKPENYLFINISEKKFNEKILNKLVRYFKRFKRNYQQSESFWILYYRLKNLIHGVSSKGENNQVVKFGLSYSYGFINSEDELIKFLRMYHYFIRYYRGEGYLSSRQAYLLTSIVSTDNKVITSYSSRDDILSLLNNRYHYDKLSVKTLEKICLRIGVSYTSKVYTNKFLDFHKINLQKKIMKKLSLRFGDD
ncbi:MAG: RNA-directed DNA polymerase [Streptococcus gordonii]|nr:RNA-directed DNA polymerase [Streptococcus gordonii]